MQRSSTCILNLDESVLERTVPEALHGCLLYILKQPVLPLDVSLYSSLHAVPERVRSLAACAASGHDVSTCDCAAS